MSWVNKGHRGHNKGQRGAPGWQRVNQSALPGKKPPQAPRPLPAGYSVSTEETRLIQREQYRLEKERWDAQQAVIKAQWEKGAEAREKEANWRAEERRVQLMEQEAMIQAHPVPEKLTGADWGKDERGVQLTGFAWGTDQNGDAELQYLRYSHKLTPRTFTDDQLEEWIDELERYLPTVPEVPDQGRLASFLGWEHSDRHGHLAILYKQGRWALVRYTRTTHEYVKAERFDEATDNPGRVPQWTRPNPQAESVFIKLG